VQTEVIVLNIGMIVAIPEEIDAMFRACGNPCGTDHAAGLTIYRYEIHGNHIFVAGSGAGEIAAAATTQYLITRYDAELIVNFGVCGGLTAEMGLQRTVVVEKAVHYDFDASRFDNSMPGQYLQYPDVYIPATPQLVKLALETVPTLKEAICASADKFVEDPAIKASLHETYNADICEMEAAGILLTANRNNVPVLLIKGVSDSASGGMDEFTKMVHASAEACVQVLWKILDKLSMQP